MRSSSRQSGGSRAPSSQGQLFPEGTQYPFQQVDAVSTPRDEVASQASRAQAPGSQRVETPRERQMAPPLFPKEESEKAEDDDFFNQGLSEQGRYQQQQEEKDQLGLGLQEEDIPEELNDTARSYEPLFLLQDPKGPKHKPRRQPADRQDDYRMRDQVEQSAKQRRAAIDLQREEVLGDKARENEYSHHLFNAQAEDDLIDIGEIDIETLERRRQALNEQAREEEDRQLEDFRNKRTRIFAEEKHTGNALEEHKRLLDEITRKKEAKANRRKHEKTKTIQVRVGSSGRSLKDGVKRHKKYVHDVFGKEVYIDFGERHEFVGEDKRKKMEIVKTLPQPIRVTIRRLRCIKDKIHEGHYVISVSLMSRLAGSKLDYPTSMLHVFSRDRIPRYERKYLDSNLQKLFSEKRTQWEFFDGLPDSNELVYDKAIYMNVPSNQHIRPSNLLLFELIWYRGNKGKVNDQVVGWGVFPLINSDFSLNEGRFKVPLIFGPVNYSIDKYFDIQKEMQKNLDSWLCNVYIEMQKLPPSLQEFSEQLTNMNKTLVQQTGEDLGRGGGFDTQLMRTQNAFDTGQQRDYTMLDNRIIRIKKIFYLLNIAQHEEEIKNNSEYLRLDDYTFAVSQKELYSRHNTLKKLRFIGDQAFSDISFYNARSSEFWISFLILVLCLWLRMYLHYLGDFIMLKMMGETVSEFNPTPYYVQMSYSRDIGVWKLFGVMVFGPLFNTIIFSLLLLISLVTKCIYQRHKCRCQIPALLYKVFATFGIVTILDFLLIFVVELFVMLGQSGNIVVKDSNSWVPDTFLLYYGYIEHKYTFVGVLLTIFTYFTITAINVILFCIYIISFHMNGRLRDIYNRLAGDQTKFFIPYDNEVSLEYLLNLREQIEMQYREARRPKKVKKFITVEEGEVDRERLKKNEAPPLFIKLIKKKDNEYELARCFQKNPDGSILELNPKALDRQSITQREMDKIYMEEEARPEEGLILEEDLIPPQRGSAASRGRRDSSPEDMYGSRMDHSAMKHGLDLLPEEEGSEDEEDANEESRLSMHGRQEGRDSLLKKKMQ